MRSGHRTIWKFQVPVNDDIAVEMPKGAEILHIDAQEDVPCIWAMVDPTNDLHTRRFRMYGTGHPMHVDEVETHVGSFMLYNGQLVFHVFEVALAE
jgi:hypothetical protein